MESTHLLLKVQQVFILNIFLCKSIILLFKIGNASLDIDLVVLMKPVDILLSADVDNIDAPEHITIKCSVRAVPPADLNFYRNYNRNDIYSPKASLVYFMHIQILKYIKVVYIYH